MYCEHYAVLGLFCLIRFDYELHLYREYDALDHLVLVLIKDNVTIKRMPSHWASVHPGTFLTSVVIS